MRWTGLTVFVDKRITLGAFKKNMELVVGIPSEHFKVWWIFNFFYLIYNLNFVLFILYI